MDKRIQKYFLSLLSGVLVLAGCATTSSPFVVENPYINNQDGVATLLPNAQWELVRSDGSLRAFHHRHSSAGILLHETCGESDNTSLPILSKHLFFGFRNKEILHQEEVPLHGVTALKSLLRAELDGVPLQIRSYVIRAHSCVYDFVYYARPEDFAEGEQDFERVVHEVHLTPQKS